jgi:hypothetical protein
VDWDCFIVNKFCSFMHSAHFKYIADGVRENIVHCPPEFVISGSFAVFIHFNTSRANRWISLQSCDEGESSYWDSILANCLPLDAQKASYVIPSSLARIGRGL